MCTTSQATTCSGHGSWKLCVSMLSLGGQFIAFVVLAWGPLHNFLWEWFACTEQLLAFSLCNFPVVKFWESVKGCKDVKQTCMQTDRLSNCPPLPKLVTSSHLQNRLPLHHWSVQQLSKLHKPKWRVGSHCISAQDSPEPCDKSIHLSIGGLLPIVRGSVFLGPLDGFSHRELPHGEHLQTYCLSQSHMNEWMSQTKLLTVFFRSAAPRTAQKSHPTASLQSHSICSDLPGSLFC